MNKKLKPCPFCGDDPSYEGLIGEGPYYFVLCSRADSCGAETNAFHSQEEAVRAWNLRLKARK